MPQKRKRYPGIKFAPSTIRAAHAYLSDLDYQELRRAYPDASPDGPSPTEAEVSVGAEDWTFDELDEFVTAYRSVDARAARLTISYRRVGRVSLEFFGATSTLSVARFSRDEVERVFELFEAGLEQGRVPDPEAAIEQSVRIFIGHGRDPAWRDLKDHLQDQHRFDVSAYEVGARAGYSIQEVLAEMVSEASFALLVHTAEDDTADGAVHARQNVVHETGLFQGRLGFRRAIILREEGCEGFSNIAGTAEIRYSRGNIREAFGDVLATIYREFGAPRS